MCDYQGPREYKTYSAAPAKERLSYSPPIANFGGYEGTFWLLGKDKPTVFIRDGIIHIGCFEATIEAVKALAEKVSEYEKPSRYLKIQ